MGETGTLFEAGKCSEVCTHSHTMYGVSLSVSDHHLNKYWTSSNEYINSTGGELTGLGCALSCFVPVFLVSKTAIIRNTKSILIESIRIMCYLVRPYIQLNESLTYKVIINHCLTYIKLKSPGGKSPPIISKSPIGVTGYIY